MQFAEDTAKALGLEGAVKDEFIKVATEEFKSLTEMVKTATGELKANKVKWQKTDKEKAGAAKQITATLKSVKSDGNLTAEGRETLDLGYDGLGNDYSFDPKIHMSKTAGPNLHEMEKMMEKVIAGAAKQQKRVTRPSDFILAAALGAPMIGSAYNALFAKSKEKKRFGSMMEEASERGYHEISESPDPEKVEAAFKIVNTYSPNLASHPLLAVNATRHILENALNGIGGLDPNALPQLFKAEKSIQEINGSGYDSHVDNVDKVMRSVERIAGSY